MKIVWGTPRPGLHNMPLFLGQSKGIFTVPGTDCTIYENISGADYTIELVKGRFDMGHVGTPPGMAALERSNEYNVIGTGVCNYPPFYLIAKPSITSVKDLVGSNVSINKFGSCPDSVLKALLAKENLNASQVNIVTLLSPGNALDAIANGEIQAAILEEPWVSYAERKYNWHVVEDCPKVLRPSNYCFLLYYRRSIIEKNPELVKGYLEAYKKSCEYAINHTQEILDLDYKFQCEGHTPNSQDVLNALNREVSVWNTNLDIDWNIIKAAESLLKKQGVVSERFHIENYIVNLE
jgi:NitT/TauT family transport system substrate-binding protein